VRDLPILGRGKRPLPSQPQNGKNFFGWSWRRGLFPPPLIVMSSEARHLLLLCFLGGSLEGDPLIPSIDWGEGQLTPSAY